MRHRLRAILSSVTCVALNGLWPAMAEDPAAGGAGAPAQRPHDPAAAATAVQAVPPTRPEQQLTEHDRSDIFDPKKPAPITPP
jgi:hypothetical protein